MGGYVQCVIQIATLQGDSLSSKPPSHSTAERLFFFFFSNLFMYNILPICR